MPSPNEITVAQLARLVGTPDCPTLVDLCIDEDFALDPRLIPTAFRHSHQQLDSLADKVRGSRVVLYCQKGLKISQGANALLQNRGIQTECLVGGQFAWRDAKQPLITADKLPVNAESGRSLWVTRHRPKIDRIACPWLIRRFIDRDAQFMFVPPDSVEAIAEKYDATPFDVDGVYWTHRGNRCTFDTILEEFELSIEALQKVADIIRGADTSNLSLTAESSGLLAISLGLSRMYKHDLQQLDNGMLIYDALYRWARDAQHETHDWHVS